MTGLVKRVCSRCLSLPWAQGLWNAERQGHGQFDSLSKIWLDPALLLEGSWSWGGAKLRVRHSVMLQLGTGGSYPLRLSRVAGHPGVPTSEGSQWGLALEVASMNLAWG